MFSTDVADKRDDADEASSATRTRAEPMAPSRRRAMIADSAVPLYLEYGPELSTRQLAEHLDISEGTIYRAFGDKESLLRAVVEAFLAGGRARMAEGIVDPALPLQEKVAALISGTRVWMRNAMRMMSLVGRDEAAQLFSSSRDGGYTEALAAAFAPDAERLNIPLDRLGVILRVAGIAAGVAHRVPGDALSDDELAHFILYGIAGVHRGMDR